MINSDKTGLKWNTANALEGHAELQPAGKQSSSREMKCEVTV